MSYECHITVTIADAAFAEKLAKDLGWKTSEIKRDPVLGDTSHFYLTKHDADCGYLYNEMKKARYSLIHGGVTPLREKIEHIIHDSKTGIVLPTELRCS